MIERLKNRIGRACDRVKMAMAVAPSPVHDLIFQAVQHQKIRLGQIVMRNKNAVIRDGEDRISLRLIGGLHLLGPDAAVR